jgi:hypothetical protein
VFRQWLLEESSLGDLYDSAVDAFPNTTMRQHATQPIKMSNFRWVPYLGMKTLFVRAEARNEEREYSPIIVFKNVRYHDEDAPGLIKIRSEGRMYYLEQPSLEDSDVLVRCSCGDFFWRFNYFDHLDKSLSGPKRKKYEAKHNPGSANPMRLPGECKHLMKMAEVLRNTGIIQ